MRYICYYMDKIRDKKSYFHMYRNKGTTDQLGFIWYFKASNLAPVSKVVYHKNRKANHIKLKGKA